jgi:8-oxo-dGTP pyrophosphatase MutT (NUDIX family)
MLEGMDELVDVVDEDNKVLYQVMKREAHEKGLLHRCVVSEVYDSKGRWLLVKQAADRQDAGQLVSPVGGHVAAGESEDDALKREALEEIGLKDLEYKLKGRAIYNREVLGRKENHYFILYEITSDEPLTLNYESVGYETFTTDELKQALRETPARWCLRTGRLRTTFWRAFPSVLASHSLPLARWCCARGSLNKWAVCRCCRWRAAAAGGNSCGFSWWRRLPG